VALVTAPSVAVGADLCRRLLEERLVACGNVVPGIRSIYRWKGQVADEAEVLLVLKTVRSRVPELIARTRELHPYEVPEILVLDVETGHVPYLEWVTRETGS
jgi:periplasmic divalent cation tolerance protein